jgi:hypothetical protein
MTTRDDLRVGDTEREEVMAALREHFAQGRLTHDELDERLGTALAARTSGELRQVMADLPVTAAPRPSHDERPATFTRPGRGPWRPGPPSLPPHADLATWGYHLAARRDRGCDRPRNRDRDRLSRRPRGHHGRPPVLLFVLGALLLAGAVSGSFWALFGLFKVLFVAWLVIALLRFTRHRRHHHHARARHDH